MIAVLGFPLNLATIIFDALQEIFKAPTLIDEYVNFTNAHIEAAAECIQTKQRAKHRVSWETLVDKKK